MDIVILDLEWNGSYSRKKKGYINEIIEFGAVKCDENLNKLDTFSCFVKPQVTKKLSSIISDLTSITDENLTDGVTFMRAVSQFKRWCGDAAILTWGTSDILALIENCKYFSGTREVPFLTRYCDLQVYVEDVLQLGSADQVGLSRAAELVGIDPSEMELHRALDDSLLSYEIFKKTYEPEQLLRHIQLCDPVFYDRITFKTTYILDLDNPLVEKNHLRFPCPKCGARTKRNTPWQMKNKSFRAHFFCGSCGYRFAGRLIIKQKYEGLTVNKKTFPLPILETPRAPQPGPVGSMQLSIAQNGIGLLQFPEFLSIPGISHAFSTRIGGVSKNEFSATNLGFGRGDADENVLENYRLMAEAMAVPGENFVCGAQDHNINIQHITAEHTGMGIHRPKSWESVDGLCTDTVGIPLVIYCADCVPLYFIDETHHAIGLAHAGWKGTAAGMAKAMVEKMQQTFGTRPQDLQVAVGPSICKTCFEVDPPVAEVFQALPQQDFFVEDSGDGKFHIDLWECNRRFLLDAGVLPQHIHIGNVCSMCESDLVFSHRKTRGQRGSNAAFLCLTQAP